MKRIAITLTILCSLVGQACGVTFTEFYCNFATGSNVNAGSTTGAAAYTAANGAWDKDHDTDIGAFTPASGDPSASVSVGDFVSIYADGAALTTFVGRVLAVDSTHIHVSQTAMSGVIADDAANGVTCKAGGAWKGPNADEGFPLEFVAGTLTNAAGNYPRINLKNNAEYDITQAIACAVVGPVYIQGYTSTVGDGGKAVIDSGTTNGNTLAVSAEGNYYIDLELKSTTTTGVASKGIYCNTSRCVFQRLAIHGYQNYGIENGAAGNFYIEVEVYDCQKATPGTAGGSGTRTTAASYWFRPYVHDNGGTGALQTTYGHGMYLGEYCMIVNPIVANNKGVGLWILSDFAIYGGDIYANGSDGINLAAVTNHNGVIENCNFIDNAGWGINCSGAARIMGVVNGCGFGAGTMANDSGTTTGFTRIFETGSVTYAANVTPWTAPDTGNFTLSLAAARGAGLGAFTQTAAGKTGTTSKPDIGAAAHGGVFPGVGDVESPVAFGAAGTEYTGTFGVPPEAEVKTGTTYGAGGTEFTGSMSRGGGGHIIGG